jgi:hypothetical protein
MSYIPASRLAAVSISAVVALLALSGIDLAIPSESTWAGSTEAAVLGAHNDVAASVNRADKTDRGALVLPTAETTTLSFQLIGQADASIVMRLPSADVPHFLTARNGAGPARPGGDAAHKMMIACEPSVSPLAAAARTLAPGRCVT